MKSIFYSILLLLVSFSTNAQLTEGHFTYSIEMKSDNPDMQMAIGMMQGSSMDLYVMGTKTRVDMKMGTMMEISTITDQSDKVLMLMGGMLGKNAIVTTISELEKNKADYTEPTLTLIDETKTINGFICKKALLTDADGNESLFWYTEDIVVSKKGQSYLNANVPGFPLEYSINVNGMTMSLNIKDIVKKLDKNQKKNFEIKIPEGYQEMTLDQLQGLGGM
jgi:GLPGLI family protein